MVDKPDWSSVSKGLRSFKEGLDKKLLWAYWLAIKEHAWETIWGAGLVGIPFGIFTLYYPPSRPLLGWVVAWAILVAGYFAWRADHVRLEKKIEVTQVRRHTWDRGARLGVQYYFEIVNKSEGMTIRQIRAQLKEMIPEIDNISWLPIVLHQQHDNVTSYAQSFDLAPSEPKNLDLLSGIDGEQYFNVTHIVPSIRAVVQLTGRHRLKVMILATTYRFCSYGSLYGWMRMGYFDAKWTPLDITSGAGLTARVSFSSAQQSLCPLGNLFHELFQRLHVAPC